jgi:DNA-binding beta-propeller fold protein YncE
MIHKGSIAGGLEFGLLLALAALMQREASLGLGARDSSGLVSEPAEEIFFVSNVVDGSVSLITAGEGLLVATMDIVPDGRRVGFLRDPLQWLAQPFAEARGGLNFAQDTDLSRDGTVLFVSRGFLGDVAAFDIGTGALLWRTPVAGVRADHMTLSPGGSRLYVSALLYGGNVVEVLDSASGAKLGEFATGPWPHDVHTSTDGARVYAASLGDMQKPAPERDLDPHAYSVTVVNARTLEREHIYNFSAGVRPFALTADGDRLYAQLSNAHAVVARDLYTGTSIGRLELPVAAGVTEADWDFDAPHHGLALSPDEQTLCLAGRASDYAALVDAEGLHLIITVPVGDAPSWAVFNAAGDICALANTRSDDVSLVSVADAVEISRIAVGRAPKHITVGRVPETLLQELLSSNGRAPAGVDPEWVDPGAGSL